MVSQKNRDAEAGLQVVGILGIFWTIGFFYWTRDSVLSGDGFSQLSMTCCNTMNFLLTIIFLAAWKYTHKENKISKYLDEHFLSNDSVSIKHLADKFKITDTSAIKILVAWMSETKIKGDYDSMTGIFKKRPVEIASSEVIDIEFDYLSDEPVEGPKEFPFCPECGGKIITRDGRPDWCEKCKKFLGVN